MSTLTRSVTKPLIFGLFGLCGGLIGALAFEGIKWNTGKGLVNVTIQVAAWCAFLTIGIGLALVIGQKYYLKSRILNVKQLGLAIIYSSLAGAIGGAIAQILYWYALHAALANKGSAMLPRMIRVLAWALAGGLLASGMPSFIPNLKRLRALAGGALGGALGAISFLIVIQGMGFNDFAGRITGVSLLGFFIGIMIAVVEATFREGWLEVHYGPKEVRTVSLGPEKVSIGSDQTACTVYAANAAPIAYRYWMKDNAVFCEDVPAKRTSNVAPGDRKQIGRIEAVVCGVSGTAKAGQAAGPAHAKGSSFSLRLSNGRTIPLASRAKVSPSDLPGLHSVPPGGPVAQVTPHPTDPSIQGLQNLSHLPWRVRLPNGDSIEVKPGKNVRLVTGTRINFGSIEGTIDA